MNKKLKKAFLSFQKSKKTIPSAYFHLADEKSGKKTKVTLTPGSIGKPKINLSYFDSEIEATLSADLDELIGGEILALPKSGYRVTLEAANGDAPPIGAHIALKPDIVYYAINDSQIVCGGNMLNHEFTGEFLRRFPARCATSNETQNYDEFKLL
ncbi:hypothetical protein QFZ20_002056 [Flavobacterium sp. W4I14]|nr:hypothetical protein [Flavobacterium sp. W4I14]